MRFIYTLGIITCNYYAGEHCKCKKVRQDEYRLIIVAKCILYKRRVIQLMRINEENVFSGRIDDGDFLADTMYHSLWTRGVIIYPLL